MAPISAAASMILSSCWRRIGTARSPRAGANAGSDGLPSSAVGALLRDGAPTVAFRGGGAGGLSAEPSTFGRPMACDAEKMMEEAGVKA